VQPRSLQVGVDHDRAVAGQRQSRREVRGRDRMLARGAGVGQQERA
jgi:hypothetical protein